MKQLDMTQQQSRLRRMIRSGIAFLVAGSTLLIGGSLVASFVQSDSRQQRADLQIGLFAEKKLQEFRENNVRYIFLGDSLSMPNAGGGETPQLRVANQIRSNQGGKKRGSQIRFKPTWARAGGVVIVRYGSLYLSLPPRQSSGHGKSAVLCESRSSILGETIGGECWVLFSVLAIPGSAILLEPRRYF